MSKIILIPATNPFQNVKAYIHLIQSSVFPNFDQCIHRLYGNNNDNKKPTKKHY